MITREKIDAVKAKLGSTAFDIMAKEIPLENVDLAKKLCKSPFNPHDDHPSAHWFDEGNCLKDFSSHRTMDYIDFAMKYHNKSFNSAVKEMFDLIAEPYEESDFEEKTNKDYFRNFKYAQDEPDSDLKQVEDYCSKRCISIDTIEHFGLKQSRRGDIAFQFKDENGKLIQTKYRVSHHADNGDFKWYWQKDSDNCPLLYGIDKIDTEKPLVITEGYMDALSVYESNIQNVVSVPGGASDLNWIDFNFDTLEKCQNIILWFDDDEAGTKAVKEAASRLGLYKVKIVQSDKEVKESIKEFYLKYKKDCDKIDANNVLICCGKEKVEWMVDNAKEIENPRLKKLFSYEEIELCNMPYVSSGFKAVDKVIYGNFENNFVVLSGFSGAGKSSILSEMGIISPMECGKKVMIFSGEANGGTLLGNTFRPLAGREHIIEYDNSKKGVPNGYVVTYKAKDAIRNFYMDKIWNYEDGEELTTSATEILNSMEYAYKRYGVTFFTLDNLMTITTAESTEDDKYASQIKFAMALKRFTRKYPVTVILVAHSKKPAPGQTVVDMYSVSGASEIVNLSDRGFSVGILKDDPEGYNSYLSIMKDRQTGKVGQKIKMFFDRPSGRIYSDEEELYKKYSWEKDFVPEYDAYTKDKIVGKKALLTGKEEVFGTL